VPATGSADAATTATPPPVAASQPPPAPPSPNPKSVIDGYESKQQALKDLLNE
jgi:hypothetical protein